VPLLSAYAVTLCELLDVTILVDAASTRGLTKVMHVGDGVLILVDSSTYTMVRLRFGTTSLSDRCLPEVRAKALVRCGNI